MSSAGSAPILDVVSFPVDFNLLANKRLSTPKPIGFTAFKEASVIFKEALERTNKSRGNH